MLASARKPNQYGKATKTNITAAMTHINGSIQRLFFIRVSNIKLKWAQAYHLFDDFAAQVPCKAKLKTYRALD